jgi:hypothetical protein
VNAQVFPCVNAIARPPQNEIVAQHAYGFQFVFRQGRSPGNRKPFVQEERVIHSEVWRHRVEDPLGLRLYRISQFWFDGILVAQALLPVRFYYVLQKPHSSAAADGCATRLHL